MISLPFVPDHRAQSKNQASKKRAGAGQPSFKQLG
jgi:hypothetical protein